MTLEARCRTLIETLRRWAGEHAYTNPSHTSALRSAASMLEQILPKKRTIHRWIYKCSYSKRKAKR